MTTLALPQHDRDRLTSGVFAVAIPHERFASELVIVDVHVKVAALLRRPVGIWILGAWRNPNLPRSDMDEDDEVDIDQTFHCPFLRARKVALPECFGVAVEVGAEAE